MSAVWSSSRNQDSGAFHKRVVFSDASPPPELSPALQRCCSECHCTENSAGSVQPTKPEPSDGALPSLEEIHRLFLASLLPDYNVVRVPTTGDPARYSMKRRSNNIEDGLSPTKTKISRIVSPLSHPVLRASEKHQRAFIRPAPVRRNTSKASNARDITYRHFLLETTCAVRAYRELLAVAPEHDYCMILTPSPTMSNFTANVAVVRSKHSDTAGLPVLTARSPGFWRSPELSHELGKIYCRRDFLKLTEVNENGNFVKREVVLQSCLSGGAYQHHSSFISDNVKDSVIYDLKAPGVTLGHYQCYSERISTLVETEAGKNESLSEPAQPHGESGAPAPCPDREEAAGNTKTTSKKQKNAEVHRCSSCETVFRTKRSLIVHMRRHTGERPFRCYLCPGAFMSQQVLYYHMLRHSNSRPWKCDLCSKAYVKKHFLDVHMRRGHKMETLFKCNLCTQAFAVATSLEVHKRAHTAEGKLSLCRICLATFPDRHALLQHALANHSNVRPFICNRCGKSFALPSALKNHSRVHRHDVTTVTASEKGGSSSDVEWKPLPQVSASTAQQV